MKKKVLILVASIGAVALLTSAFVLLTPKAKESGPSGAGEPSGVTSVPVGDERVPEGTGDGEGQDTEDPNGEGGPEAEPDTESVLEAARVLANLGILRGDGVDEAGNVELDLEATLTREQAAAMIARTRGYASDGEDAVFPCHFDDVSRWASGAVGYLNRSGVVSGYSETSFRGDGLVEGRELLSMVLHSAGYGGDYAYADIMGFAEGLGLTDGGLGDGTKPVTRGEAAVILKNMLALPLKGSDRTPLTVLTESGAVTAEQLAAAGLEGTVPGLRADAIGPGAVAEMCAPLTVTVETRDLKLAPVASLTGTIAGDGLIALPLDGLRGAAYITVTDAAGDEISWTALSVDPDGEVAYLRCAASFPDIETAGPGASAADLAYVYSDKATLVQAPASVKARPGLPVLDDSGRFVGITTAVGVAPAHAPEETTDLYALGKTYWPEDALPFRPRGIDPTKPMVAVTYDDGPSKATTPKLLDILEENNAVATFFECGYMLVKYTGSLQRMEDMGCEIGNHSYSHANLKKLSADGIREEIDKTNEIIRGVVGHDATVVRAPYGSVNDTVKSTVDVPLIQWNVDTLDWKIRKADSVIGKVFANKNLDGYIILMHSLYSSTVEASRTIIPRLIEQGYQTVTVSELAYFRGVTMETGKLYHSFKP